MAIEKHTVVSSDDIEVSVEISRDFPDMCVIHCDIHNWSHTKYQDYLTLWVDIVEGMKEHGIELIRIGVKEDNSKLIKFASMFGFGIIGGVERHDGSYLVMEMET